MSSKWKPVPHKMPTDGQSVYCRTWNELAAPFLAIYNATDHTFVETAHGIVFPAYVVYKWYQAA